MRLRIFPGRIHALFAFIFYHYPPYGATMFSLNKNYPENKNVRQMLTDFVVWGIDENYFDCKDELKDFIRESYQLIRDCLAQQIIQGDNVLRYKIECIGEDEISYWGFHQSFGLFDFDLLPDNPWRLAVVPSIQLLQYVHDPSKENFKKLSNLVLESLNTDIKKPWTEYYDLDSSNYLLG